MNVVVAVAVVGLGSLLLRIVPLVGARRLPDALAEVAEVAGLALLGALVVRSAVLHDDPAIPGAPVVAALSAGVGLLLAFRGRSVLVAVSAGAATYLVLSAAVAATTT